MTHREADTPNWALSAAEKIQSFENRLPLSGLIKLIAGSDYPLYHQIRWHKVDEVWDFATETPAEMPIAKADPNAHTFSSVVPRLKKSAAVIEAGKRLPEVRNSLAKEYGPARVSIAYDYKDQTHVGDLPAEIISLRTINPNIYRAAMRTGKNDFGAAIGIWLIDEQTFVMAPDSTIAANNVPIGTLYYRCPDVNLF